MTPFEAVMWELERDPNLSSMFANLTTLDRPPDRDLLRARLIRTCGRVPRLRQRVRTPNGRFSPPEWHEDPDFDVDRHLRWIDLGGNAGHSELTTLVATLSRQPLDRSRPLWEFIIIEGLADGRAAMLQRLHHTITDGEGGIRLSVEFLDLERDPPPSERPGEPTSVSADVPTQTDDTPSSFSRLGSTAAAALRQPVDLIAGVLAGVGGAVAHPSTLGDSTSRAAATVNSAIRQVVMDPRHSPIWRERSLDRWFDTTQVSLAEVIDAAHAIGATVNDVFVAGAAAAAGEYHRLVGAPIDALRVSIPISTRHDRSAGGNAFSPSQSLVPTGEMDPIDRVRAVHEILSDVKGERALDSVDTASSWLALLPSVVVVRAGQQIAGAVDFVCSNVKAAPFDLFVAGSLIEGNYPIGPLAGTAFNLTTMSYNGQLCMGLVVDTAAVERPEMLLAEVNRAYEEILGAVARIPDRSASDELALGPGEDRTEVEE